MTVGRPYDRKISLTHWSDDALANCIRRNPSDAPRVRCPAHRLGAHGQQILPAQVSVRSDARTGGQSRGRPVDKRWWWRTHQQHTEFISDATPGNDWKPGAQYAAGPRGPKDRALPLHVPSVGESVVSTYRAGQVTIVNNAQTGISTVDDTTEKLKTVLEKVVNARPEGFGPEYGRTIHYDFGDAVKAENLPRNW